MEGVRIFSKDLPEFQHKSKEEIIQVNYSILWHLFLCAALYAFFMFFASSLSLPLFLFIIFFFFSVFFSQHLENDLKDILSGLATHLFGNVPMRWNKDFFPFTEPSYELEVQFNGNWMEVLGCGVIHHQVMKNSNRSQDYGWAFGLGLERLAMILFDIPDIRLFWSEDERFSSQFKNGNLIKFIPYSKFPLCYKDVSFWLPKNEILPDSDAFHPNDVYDVSYECFFLLLLVCSDFLFFFSLCFSSFFFLFSCS
jgi:hypothetical protein